MATQSRPIIVGRPPPGRMAAPKQRTASPAIWRGPPVAPMAYDPGYSSLGGPAPILVLAQPSWSRPGSVTAAATIAFVLAGIGLYSAFLWLGMNTLFGPFGVFAFEAILYGIANLAIAAACILGGAGALGRKSWCRYALIFAVAVELCLCVYRITQGVWMGLIYVTLGALLLVFIHLPDASRFLSTRSPVSQY